MIANDREKLKAFLVAEIKGWTMAVNDPDGRRDARRRELRQGPRPDLENSIAGATEQADRARRLGRDGRERPVHDLATTCRKRRSRASRAPASTLDADDLFDLSLLAEVYEENPDLIAYASSDSGFTAPMSQRTRHRRVPSAMQTGAQGLTT